MKPLIVAATEDEILPSIEILKEYQIPYLITGVGMTATAFQLGKYIAQTRPSYILNVGIAGSFSKDIPLGTLVNILEDSISELGAEDDNRFLPIEELGFGHSTYQSSYHPQATIHLLAASAITVNTVHGNASSIRHIRERFPAANMESMEGASVFLVATAENIPCLQIRAVSNYIETRNRSTWNIPLAVKNLNLWLKDYIKQSEPVHS